MRTGKPGASVESAGSIALSASGSAGAENGPGTSSAQAAGGRVARWLRQAR